MNHIAYWYRYGPKYTGTGTGTGNVISLKKRRLYQTNNTNQNFISCRYFSSYLFYQRVMF